MPHDDRLWYFKRIEHADNVADQMKERELLNGLGTVRLTVASHIRGDGVETRVGECNKLMPPRVPRLREPMTHNHKRAGPCLSDVHIDAVRRDSAMTDVHLSLLHRLCSSSIDH
jgi:hypothetical protein